MSEQKKEVKKSNKTVYDRQPRVKLFGNSPLSAAGKRKPDVQGQAPGQPGQYLINP